MISVYLYVDDVDCGDCGVVYLSFGVWGWCFLLFLMGTALFPPFGCCVLARRASPFLWVSWGVFVLGWTLVGYANLLCHHPLSFLLGGPVDAVAGLLAGLLSWLMGASVPLVRWVPFLSSLMGVKGWDISVFFGWCISCVRYNGWP